MKMHTTTHTHKDLIISNLRSKYCRMSMLEKARVFNEFSAMTRIIILRIITG